MTMTPRERVLAAINHEEPDRIPIVIGVSNATGIKMKSYQGIKKLIGIDAPDNYIYDWPELGTAEIDEATMQGMDVFLVNIALYPEFARALLHKITEVCKSLMGSFLEELGDNVDIIKIGDDLGTQDGLMISPNMWRH